MENGKFKFDTQVSTELFRKWYILSKKDPSNPYDKEQVDDICEAIKSQIGDFLKQLVEEELQAYRVEIPFFYINGKNFENFAVEVVVIGTKIECLNMPGCMVEGENRKIAFNNLLKAVVQCADARIKNGLWFLNRVFPIKFNEFSHEALSSHKLIQKLKNEEWTKEYIGPYHIILLRDGSKVTYTIPHNTEISSVLHICYNRYRFLIR